MKILCIGGSAYDITLPMDEYPKENNKYKINGAISCGGGSSNNAAYLLSLWNENVYLASAIGKDHEGSLIKKELLDKKVNIDYLEELDIPTTKSYIIANKSNGTRTIISNKDPLMKLTNYKDINLDFDYIFTDGNYYDYTSKVISSHKESTVIIDAGRNSEETIKLCHLADYIVCSNDFAKSVSEIDFKYDEIDKIKKCYDVLESMFKGKIIITLESYGSFTKINNEYHLIPSVKVESVDSTGAGDIYHAAFVYFISHGYNLLDTMKYSNIAGAISVTRLGSKASIPTLDEVTGFHEL